VIGIDIGLLEISRQLRNEVGKGEHAYGSTQPQSTSFLPPPSSNVEKASAFRDSCSDHETASCPLLAFGLGFSLGLGSIAQVKSISVKEIEPAAGAEQYSFIVMSFLYILIDLTCTGSGRNDCAR